MAPQPSGSRKRRKGNSSRDGGAASDRRSRSDDSESREPARRARRERSRSRSQSRSYRKKSRKRQKRHQNNEGDGDVKARAGQVAEELEECAGNPGGFVWKKKLEKELQSGKSTKEVKHTAAQRMADKSERMQEVEKVRKRREERQAELARMEEQKEHEAREKALAEAEEVEQREEQQQLEQAKTRSEMRLKEGRGRNADILARNIHGEPGPFVDTTSVDAVFEGATARELEELRSDFSAYVQLEQNNPSNFAFWQAMLTACDFKLKEASHLEEVDKAKLRGEQPPQRERTAGLHEAVERDVHKMLSGKSHRELKRVEEDILSRLKGNDFADAEYWDTVLKQLEVWLAMAYAREQYETRRQQAASVLTGEDQWQNMQQKQGNDDVVAIPTDGDANDDSAPAAELDGVAEGSVREQTAEGAAEAEEEEEDELLPDDLHDEEQQQAMLTRQLSPEQFESPEMCTEQGEQPVIVDEEQDAKRIDQLRDQIAKESRPRFEAAARTAAQPGTTEQEDMLRALKDSQHVGSSGLFSNIVHKAEDATETEGERQAREKALKEMGVPKEGEEQFGADAEQQTTADASQAYWYHDKYRPRKPKYFNRVHTGFDWNKYNKSHYDKDNPPPKQVIGYKFNIFYPDLIDKSHTPKYTIEPDGSKHGETCIIRFSAGPPYEDVAFKIINREWDTAPNKGFKCSFERGVLHLFFNFNRARYRR